MTRKNTTENNNRTTDESHEYQSKYIRVVRTHYSRVRLRNAMDSIIVCTHIFRVRNGVKKRARWRIFQ
jgi:hypothetical protein